MVKILKSVGKNATNDIHDVAAVQMALKKAKPVKVGCPWYNGPIDGKISHALTNAIIEFQMEHCIRETGKIDPISPTRSAINRALNANWCGVRGLEGTTCLYVPGPYPGFNALTETKKKAPFPDGEVTGLVRLMANIQKEFDLTLTCSNDNITQDGRFATTLAINYDQFVDNATATLLPKGKVPNAACNIIHKYVKSIAEWNEGSANDLDFTSKRQLQCLKNAKQPSAAYLKEIGIPMPMDTCAKKLIHGAENIDTISITINERHEFATVKQALDRVDSQTSSKMKLKEDRKMVDVINPATMQDDMYEIIENCINTILPLIRHKIRGLEAENKEIKDLFLLFFYRAKAEHFIKALTNMKTALNFIVSSSRRTYKYMEFMTDYDKDQMRSKGDSPNNYYAFYLDGIIYINESNFKELYHRSNVLAYKVMCHEYMHAVLNSSLNKEHAIESPNSLKNVSVEIAIENVDSYVEFIFG